ncbi:TPA: hypothetical protein IAD41_01315 [Candidatus Scatenecus faecavium]|uniref:Uncharacterized protein n=1 Tax=Candidatus Scatenecus faecavium TaxID=2840915 RepID=A0A9D1FUK9_9BACT|nr:hypothetical protein [Candidatus Scatenecus faecavium]
MKIKLLSVILSLVMLAGTAFAGPFSANAKTKRIPAGTKLSLQLLSPVTTVSGRSGGEFQAMIVNDQSVDSDVILPAGSMVRGSISKIVAPKRMSKGAILYMDFDHVVTPNGRQIPLSLSITGREDLTYDGGIVNGRGFGEAFRKTMKKSGDITKNSVNWANETFEDPAGGYFRLITVPVAAVGGAIGSTGYFVYDTIGDMVRKGEEVDLNTGEVLNVILTEPVDVPVI